jgi:zinc transport system ATP-binding protein
MSEEAPLLRCERLVVGHAGRPLLPPCDLAIRPGTLVLVVGRNGSGKTTFFRTVLGLLPPVAGGIWRPPGLRVSYVGQIAALDRNLPVRARDVVGWGLQHGWSFLRPGRPRRAACDRALAEAGVPELGDRLFPTLSEGQKQRVLLARMLAADPQIGFLDEPTASMDAVAEEQAIAHLAGLARGRKMAVVLISHVLGLAERFADEVVFLDRDDGVIVKGRPGEVFAHPSFHRQFGAAGVGHGR